MRVLVAGAGGVVGTRLAPQPRQPGPEVNGTFVSAGEAEPIAFGQKPVRGWCRVASGS